jgi:hypothetical protein
MPGSTDVHVLARLNSIDRHAAVLVVRRGDQNRVHVVIVSS